MFIHSSFPFREEGGLPFCCVSGNVGSRIYRSISESKNSCLSFTSTFTT